MMKILIVQTSFLGDTILSTPVIAGVKKIYPDAELWMMTTPLSSQLVIRDPLLAGVIPFDKRGKDAGIKGLIAKAKHIREMGFDLTYALHRSHRTSLLLFLSKVPKRIGFQGAGFSFLYHHRIVRNMNEHDVLRNLSILKGDTEPDVLPSDLRLYTPSTSKLGEALRRLLPESPYAVVVPGSTWKTKRWHSDGFRNAIRYLRESGFNIVLLGSQEDTTVNRSVADGLDVVDLAGKTSISDAICIIQRAGLVVCNDSSPLHMASAFKIPTVAVFCATTPELGFGPWRNKARVVGKELDCRPCGRHGGRRCPNGTDACMNEVDFNDVVSAIDDVLGNG